MGGAQACDLRSKLQKDDLDEATEAFTEIMNYPTRVFVGVLGAEEDGDYRYCQQDQTQVRLVPRLG